ncbi:hypothetical protein [Luteipulveratus mongoliensis]|uniref:UDP-N-acetylmuramyl pentapeptide phosphotransferase/UDP-N-acetylglucosamine-1-phosphate transferase n=1 Tax=Luteipulveratus mongoliensis TaxID=571913 RepID=A0A0K1JIZ1_9MICO|nr:hypothetical protein [Luteipulveratus mongoliensis]AKU16689.1 hypothetical protein VV02_13805 [Luteipulveratus mongoliensis]
MNRFVAAGIAAGATRLALPLLRQAQPGGRERWDRTNHAGRTVSLLEGPAVVLGAATTALGSPAAGLSALAAGALGVVDDLAGDTDRKGLKGHLSALAQGDVTTGAVKILGLGATGAVAAATIDRGRWSPSTIAAAGLVAGTANLLNLFDLRPGRALKVSLLLGVPTAISGSAPAAGLVGASIAALPEDLRGETMMGDTGANALGALAGVALAERLPGAGRWVALGAVVGLTMASERVSFSAVIARTPVLAQIDAWGRPRT